MWWISMCHDNLLFVSRIILSYQIPEWNNAEEREHKLQMRMKFEKLMYNCGASGLWYDVHEHMLMAIKKALENSTI